MPPVQNSGNGKSYNLDLLRACAVLFVFAAHLLETWRIYPVASFMTVDDMAQTGVLIFFVHTSLVLMLSLERQHCTGRGSEFAAFYIRRAFRVYPLVFVIVAVMLLGHVPCFPIQVYSPPAWTTVVSNLALVQNLTGAPSLYLPMWSLPYEIQMYVVLPFLFVYLRKRWQQRLLLPELWAVTVCIILTFVIWRIEAVSILYYVPCFLAGAVAYRRWSSCKRQFPFWGWPLLIVGCVLLRSIVDACTNQVWVIPAGWIICLVLGWTAPLFNEVPIPWLQRAASTVAKYSYGIYLTHVIVLWVSFVALKATPLALQIGVWLVGSVGFPVLLYHVVENPMIAAGVRITRSMARTSKPVERGEALA
jgi:peptidoglycan/LPS O-acetylase OafA/YrhL